MCAFLFLFRRLATNNFDIINLIYGHPLFLVFLVSNIIWLFLMTSLTTYGRFPYVSSPTRMTLSLISSLM